MSPLPPRSKLLRGCALGVLPELPAKSVQTCITSPPYWGLRDYGVKGQLGLEGTPDEYVENMVEVFREVRRVLADNGTLWLNLGDSYATGAGGVGQCPGGGKQGENWKLRGKMTPPNRMPIVGLKPKDLVGIPWRVAFALQADGWYLRSDIIWHKPNPMPESVTDRPTKAHEYLFLLTKSEKYLYDHEAVKETAKPESAARYKTPFFIGDKHESGKYSPRGQKHTGGIKPFDGKRNRRTVWTVTTRPFKGAHFATFPPALIEPCVLAGSRPGDLVLDPFSGAGTTGLVALRHGRRYVGIELNRAYIRLTEKRLREAAAPPARARARIKAARPAREERPAC